MNPRLIAELTTICGPGAVLTDLTELMTYECDALPPRRPQSLRLRARMNIQERITILFEEIEQGVQGVP